MNKIIESEFFISILIIFFLSGCDSFRSKLIGIDGNYLLDYEESCLQYSERDRLTGSYHSQDSTEDREYLETLLRGHRNLVGEIARFFDSGDRDQLISYLDIRC